MTRIFQPGVKDVEIGKIDTEIPADDRCDQQRTLNVDGVAKRRNDDRDEDW